MLHAHVSPSSIDGTVVFIVLIIYCMCYYISPPVQAHLTMAAHFHRRAFLGVIASMILLMCTFAPHGEFSAAHLSSDG